MELRKYGTQKVLIAEEGKHIRGVNDVYRPATKTELEYIPNYASIIFLAINVDETKVHELYVEEPIVK